MFDPIVDRIISLIHTQLFNTQETYSAMFLVGGFSESKYLQKKIRQEFQHRVKVISVPTNPVAATAHGAVIYGLSLKNFISDTSGKIKTCKGPVINTRILEFSYGIQIRTNWMEGDPINRERHYGRIDKFTSFAQRGTEVETNQEFTSLFHPHSPTQRRGVFRIYRTIEYHARYCDEPGMKLLGKLRIDLPGSGYCGILLQLTFRQMEITATATNVTNGQTFETKLELDI